VPILKALQAAAETLSNRAMRADAMEALAQARGRAARVGARRQETLPRNPVDVLAPRRADRPAPRDARRAAKQLGGEVQRRALQMATILRARC
jgi:general secretion pathway protein F